MVLTFYGGDALAVATAAKRLPLVWDSLTSTYRPARSYPEARRLLTMGSDAVRFQTDARVLLETLCNNALAQDCCLPDAVEQIPTDTVPANVRAAVIQAIKDQS